MRDRIAGILAPLGVEHFGVCRYADCLPLLGVRSRARIPAGARSVLVCLFPYHTGEFPGRNLARYAVVDDYHRVAGGILDVLTESLRADFPEAGFARFVDSSPIREVEAARMAGLGVVGLHRQLIHREYGCRVFLGEVVTTLELPPSGPETGVCLLCGKCIGACPTGAIAAAGSFDRERCRSHITQKKGELTEWEREQLAAGGFAVGCDLCADACPLNTDKLTPIRAFRENAAPVLTGETLGGLLQRKPYGFHGRAVLRRNLDLLQGRS